MSNFIRKNYFSIINCCQFNDLAIILNCAYIYFGIQIGNIQEAMYYIANENIKMLM